jgi:broad specificity phosphatase PhoE
MPKVFIVRHGQSAAQLGVVHSTYDQIPLTELGHQQAQALADSVTSRPGLIVSSPFLRAQQTSAPLRAKFPDVPFEIWDVFEFVFLDPVQCLGTTKWQRTSWRRDYWERCDPAFSYENGAESFSSFLRRARDCLNRVRQLNVESVYIFSHCQFIVLLRVLAESPPQDDTAMMRAFRTVFKGCCIENCQMFEIE